MAHLGIARCAQTGYCVLGAKTQHGQGQKRRRSLTLGSTQSKGGRSMLWTSTPLKRQTTSYVDLATQRGGCTDSGRESLSGISGPHLRQHRHVVPQGRELRHSARHADGTPDGGAEGHRTRQGPAGWPEDGGPEFTRQTPRKIHKTNGHERQSTPPAARTGGLWP